MNRKPSDFSFDQLQRLVDFVPAAIWQIDPMTLGFEYVSHGAEAILGFPVEDWLADPKFWIKHLHPEDRRWAVSFCQSALKAGHPHEFEYRMIDSDGQVVWIRDLVKIVPRPGGPPKILGIMIDVTRRHESEHDRFRVEEQLRSDRAAEALSQLTAGVAHDFNNTLTVIAMHADILRKEAPEDSRLAESLESVELALKQAISISKSLMAISGDHPSEKRELDLRTVVSRSHRMVRRILPGGIELRVENECTIPLRVCADALRIQQLILSLALDARSSMNEGGELTISLALHRGSVDDAPDIAMNADCRDTGCSDFARLCFTQRRNSDSHESQKLASGRPGARDDVIIAGAEHYPLVLEIVEDHRAVFGYEPSQWGTTIWVDFPCCPCPTEQGLESQPIAKRAAVKEVLIAGDDQQVRDIVAGSLRDSGCRVVPLASRAALEKRFFESHESVSLIVLDANSANGAAFDFLRKVRGNGHDTAAIVLIDPGHACDVYEQLGKSADGNTTLLCKPFSTISLIRLAQSVLKGGGIDP